MSALYANQSEPIHSQSRFKNRNRMEIVANLLDIARTGTLKTHLMYRANLSYVMITEYLDYLQEAELIEEISDSESSSKLFRTTEKGLHYLSVYNSLKDIAGLDSRKVVRNEKETFT